jgi:predicted lipoprotein with Yx(FWY)xxD motif
MKITSSLAQLIVCLPALTVAAQISPSELQMPPGIAARLTVEGPVFVDARGMTLYKFGRFGVNVCDDQHHPVVLQDGAGGKVDFVIMVPDLKTRRTCLQKHPPLVAPAEAQPFGKWSINVLKNGLKQWGYDGEPLYTSIKDTTVGDINGSYDGAYPSFQTVEAFWSLALAPLVGIPPGITARRTAQGLALTNSAGKVFYFLDRDEGAANPALWQPVVAPTLTVSSHLPNWSVVSRADGIEQWAYKGQPLYTYVNDSNNAKYDLAETFGNTYGQPIKGWHVALLVDAPIHPVGITINTLINGEMQSQTLQKKVYADANGMTLYTIHCIEDTADRVECDDIGDSPSYWLSFCGGEDRCAKIWHPLPALADAKSIDNTWSVIVINPRHPWRPVEKGAQGMRVWAYRGRPVFTYSNDLRPGDYNGAVTSIVGEAFVMPLHGRTIPAYEKAAK